MMTPRCLFQATGRPVVPSAETGKVSVSHEEWDWKGPPDPRIAHRLADPLTLHFPNQGLLEAGEQESHHLRGSFAGSQTTPFGLELAAESLSNHSRTGSKKPT